MILYKMKQNQTDTAKEQSGGLHTITRMKAKWTGRGRKDEEVELSSCRITLRKGEETGS